MKRRFTTELKVGLFFVVMFIMIAVMSLKLGNIGLFEQRGYTVWAIFDTAAGVNPETEVLYAGIRVGRVTDIRLVGGKARIDMLINPKVVLEKDCTVALMSKGLLGAKFIEISPGTPGAAALKDQEQIGRVDQPFDMSSLASEINIVVGDLQTVTATLREVFGDEEGVLALQEILDNIRGFSAEANQIAVENQREIHRVLQNLADVTGNLARLTETNYDALSAAMGDLPQITNNLLVITENLAQVVQNNNENLDKSLANLSDASTSLQGTLDNLNDITAKINSGEGTIGKLVNDEETINKVNETLDGISEIVKTARSMHTSVSYRADYYGDADMFRHQVDLKISPRPDKYVQIGIVSSPIGSTKRIETRTETTDNPGEEDEQTEVEEEVKEVTTEDFRFTALYARRFHDLVIRGGLIESEGGVGLDYYMLKDLMLFSVEAFDFSTEDNPRLRAMFNLYLLDHIYLGGGIDDFINEQEDPLWFVGAGLSIRDDDLSWLLTRIPLPGF